jgi:hypothetical protein
VRDRCTYYRRNGQWVLTSRVVDIASKCFASPDRWLGIALVEALLVPVGVDWRLMAGCIKAGHLLGRQLPAEVGEVLLELLLST